MHTEQRARFEAWAKEQGRTTGTLDGIRYFDPFVRGLWTAFQAAETPLLARIAELEGQLANREVLCLPAEELKELIYSIHGSHHVGDAQHTKLDIINAQIDSLYANREPFVVRLPHSIPAEVARGVRADIMLAHEVKTAITAAGGVCV